jgi:hypothetical protein
LAYFAPILPQKIVGCQAFSKKKLNLYFVRGLRWAEKREIIRHQLLRGYKNERGYI